MKSLTHHFKDKVAVITGGGSGLGQALSFELVKNGANVICSDINLELAKNTVNQIEKANYLGNACAYFLDVCDSENIINFFSAVSKKFGRIDFLFNNAGIAIGGEIRDLEQHHWRKVLDVNLYGFINCANEAYKRMIKEKKGHIINITSIAAITKYTALSTPYSVSKTGALAYSRALQLEASELGVKVLSVCPGSIKTEIGENMEHINSNNKAQQQSKDFIAKGISPNLAAIAILKAIAKDKDEIIFPIAFKLYYKMIRVLNFIEKQMAIKMITEFRTNIRLNKFQTEYKLNNYE